MEVKSLLSVLLLSHVLGDFYFQNETLAKLKDQNYKFVVVHSLIYALVGIIGSIVFLNKTSFLLSAISVLIVSIL